MSDEEPFADAPSSKTGRVKYAISNLWDDFGHVDNPYLGLVINCGLASLGLVLFVATSGLVSYLGVVWALLNLLPVFQWVLGL